MGQKIQITEYLDIDLEEEKWCCNRCGRVLVSARENYKKGCLVYDRDPRTIYKPVVDEGTFSPDPEVCRIIEFYCPGCAVMIENEVLIPGHPITYDIEPDIDALKKKYLKTGKAQEGR
jgi:acetone carboxylase, gamma subunit